MSGSQETGRDVPNGTNDHPSVHRHRPKAETFCGVGSNSRLDFLGAYPFAGFLMIHKGEN